MSKLLSKCALHLVTSNFVFCTRFFLESFLLFCLRAFLTVLYRFLARATFFLLFVLSSQSYLSLCDLQLGLILVLCCHLYKKLQFILIRVLVVGRILYLVLYRGICFILLDSFLLCQSRNYNITLHENIWNISLLVLVYMFICCVYVILDQRNLFDFFLSIPEVWLNVFFVGVVDFRILPIFVYEKHSYVRVNISLLIPGKQIR